MLLKNSIYQLSQLNGVLSQIDAPDYKKSLVSLTNSSIGKHCRHIIDFYACFFKGIESNEVCYDDRTRDLDLEENLSIAIQTIQNIIEKLSELDKDITQKIPLKYQLSDTTYCSDSTLERELLYLHEHTVHHLAIIRIGIQQELEYAQLPTEFGYAASTLAHLKK